MIYLVHGENVVDSRRFLLRLKTNYQNVVPFQGKNLKESIFKKSLEELSHNLFAEKTAIEIERFNGDFASIPKKLPKDVDLLLWSDKKIDKVPPKIKPQLFSRRENVNSFKFADALFYKNEKEAMILAAKLLDSKEPIERLLGTVNRGLYLLFCEKEKTLQGEDIAFFVKKKTADQAVYWSKSQIKKAFLYLLRTDLDIKEGVETRLAIQTFVSKVAN